MSTHSTKEVSMKEEGGRKRAPRVDVSDGVVLMTEDRGENRRVIGSISDRVRYESQGTYRTCKRKTFERWARKTKAVVTNRAPQ